MATKQEQAGDAGNAAAQQRVEQLREELKRKQQEMDDLFARSETLHPSAYGALQGQLEEEIEKLEAELASLTTAAG
jgi:uncharacterized protein YlxW (UPF0749 family)